jgi:hypothetical protein
MARRYQHWPEGRNSMTEELLDWACPTCGAPGRNALNITQTICRNGHLVVLGMRTGPSTRTAYSSNGEVMSEPLGNSWIGPGLEDMKHSCPAWITRTAGRTEEKATNPTTLRGETNRETAAPVTKEALTALWKQGSL